MSERGFLLTCSACKTPKLELLDKLASENIDTLLERITKLETRLAIKNDAHAASMLVIAELEKQLADMTALYHTNNRCECGDDEACQYVCRIQELERQLSLYQGGVEVEGKIDWKGNIQISRKCQELDNFGVGQRVRVLVIPEERIVDTNKTMEVEMAHNYCKCGGNKGSCIDCAEEEIDRLTAQLAEARAEVTELKATMPPTFKESVKTVVAHINKYYGLEG